MREELKNDIMFREKIFKCDDMVDVTNRIIHFKESWRNMF